MAPALVAWPVLMQPLEVQLRGWGGEGVRRLIGEE